MKSFSLLFLVLLSFQTKAAIPSQENPQLLAKEILSLPEANRNQIADKRGSEIYAELTRIAENSTEPMNVRWKALTLATYIGKEKALPLLEKSLTASEWFMRNAALISYKTYFPEKSQAAAQKLLKDKALVVRSAAVDAMGTDLDSKARDLLWEEMDASYNYRGKQSLWIRDQILSTLAAAPLSKELPLFVKALKSTEPKMQARAIVALEKLSQKKIGKADEKLARKKELWLQWAKSSAASEITTR